jgi:hypothetical protein
MPSNYESGGREFESLRAREYLAPDFRAKNRHFTEFTRSELAPIFLLMRSCAGVVVGAGAEGWQRSTIVHEMPNPYDQIKQQIVGSVSHVPGEQPAAERCDGSISEQHKGWRLRMTRSRSRLRMNFQFDERAVFKRLNATGEMAEHFGL